MLIKLQTVDLKDPRPPQPFRKHAPPAIAR